MRRLQSLLGALFVSGIVVANVTASKVASIPIPWYGEAIVPAGFLGIGLAFLCTDLLGELYGKKVARNTVTSAIGALAVGWILVYASVVMPAAPFYEHTQAFSTVLGASLPIVLASIITMSVSQNIDVSVFHRLKRLSDRKFVRNLGSTVTSQSVDTALFIGLAFVVLPPLFGGSAVPLAVAFGMFVSQYVVKIIVAALDTPLFYVVSGLLE